MQQIVVVGGGQAAVSAVASLRLSGYTGAISIICEEPVAPYQRPPLSKAYMKDQLALERLFLRPASWYADNGVDLLLGKRATSIDRDIRQVKIDDGRTLDYDALILATGSRARKLPLPGVPLENTFELRGLADVEHMRPALAEGKRIIVIGGGYIGLEAAASARQLGLNVTVLEYAPRVLARVTSPMISNFFEHEHRARGIDIRTDARIKGLLAESGRIAGVEMADGETLPADAVLVGVGIVPNDELAAAAGIECGDGIVVDRDARTSDPAVFACGDCARRPLVHYERTGRLESVHNAIEQGKLAAAAILDKPRPPEECPWFWSDQYDLKLQIAGLSEGFDEIVVRGSLDARKFAAFYFRDGQLLAADAVNSPQEFMGSRKIIANAVAVDKAKLADAAVPMNELIR